MRILITGGFGYLGGRIAQSLEKEGHQVVLSSREENLSPNWLKKAEVFKLDWSNKDILQSSCENVDLVIHAAGMNAQDCARNPVEAIQFNGAATERLVQASISANVNKFIYLSTAHVYQSPLVGKITEKTNLENQHPYATSHAAGEDAVLSQSSENNFTGIVLRLSNGVGAPTHKQANCWMLAVNDFCRQVIENGRITINSNREIERDFFPISLLCDTIKSIIKYDKNDINIMNVSSSQAITLDEVAKLIKERSKVILNLNPQILYKDRKKIQNKSNYCISNNKLKNILSPEISLKNEIDLLLINCKKWFG
jgi:UDP-glucose 4-epimerase